MRVIKMSQIEDIVTKLRAKQGIRQIHRETGVHRQLISKIKKACEEQGWLDSDHPPTGKEIAQRFEKDKPLHRLDPFSDKIQEWLKKGYSYTVIAQLLSKQISCTPSSLRHYAVNRFPKPCKPVMVRPTVPAEMDVDFGYLGLYWDEIVQRMRKAWFFSGRFRHSRSAYREVVTDQSQTTFSMCHVHAFEHFGGVPKRLILDNLKAGVIRSTVDNELIHRAYQSLARYYGFMISPCLVRTPEHKGGVETDVKYVKGNFLPQFKESCSERPSLQQLQRALEQWNTQQAEQRELYELRRTPLDIFETEEREHLLPLPLTRWEPTHYVTTKVRPEWRIRFDHSYYSVPYKYISETVTLKITPSQIRILHNHGEIACHPRSYNREYIRRSEHAPPEEEAILQTTRTGLLSWAERIGPHTLNTTQKLFADPTIDRLRPVRLLLKLARRFTNTRLEMACKRALHYDTLSYRSIKAILEKNLDQEPLEQPSHPQAQETFRFARETI